MFAVNSGFTGVAVEPLLSDPGISMLKTDELGVPEYITSAASWLCAGVPISDTTKLSAGCVNSAISPLVACTLSAFLSALVVVVGMGEVANDAASS